jgi:predicted ArsR family transcriptional regulator
MVNASVRWLPCSDGRFQSRNPRGARHHQIAKRLDISEKTIRNHVSAIFSKLQVKGRAQAAALARDAGLGHRFAR